MVVYQKQGIDIYDHQVVGEVEVQRLRGSGRFAVDNESVDPPLVIRRAHGRGSRTLHFKVSSITRASIA
jgi:hypothetical protein